MIKKAFVWLASYYASAFRTLFKEEKTVFCLFFCLLVSCALLASSLPVRAAPSDANALHKTPTIVFVNSYHKGYAWSDGIQQKALEILQNAGVRTVAFYLDSKRCKAKKQIREAAARIAGEIAKIQPDAIIAADDIAQKHLVVPYLKPLGVPIVYCGVNVDGSEYGYPNESATGMLEFSTISRLQDNLLRLAKGSACVSW